MQNPWFGLLLMVTVHSWLFWRCRKAHVQSDSQATLLSRMCRALPSQSKDRLHGIALTLVIGLKGTPFRVKQTQVAVETQPGMSLWPVCEWIHKRTAVSCRLCEIFLYLMYHMHIRHRLRQPDLDQEQKDASLPVRNSILGHLMQVLSHPAWSRSCMSDRNSDRGSARGQPDWLDRHGAERSSTAQSLCRWISAPVGILEGDHQRHARLFPCIPHNTWQATSIDSSVNPAMSTTA